MVSHGCHFEVKVRLSRLGQVPGHSGFEATLPWVRIHWFVDSKGEGSGLKLLIAFGFGCDLVFMGGGRHLVGQVVIGNAPGCRFPLGERSNHALSSV